MDDVWDWIALLLLFCSQLGSGEPTGWKKTRGLMYSRPTYTYQIESLLVSNSNHAIIGPFPLLLTSIMSLDMHCAKCMKFVNATFFSLLLQFLAPLLTKISFYFRHLWLIICVSQIVSLLASERSFIDKTTTPASSHSSHCE